MGHLHKGSLRKSDVVYKARPGVARPPLQAALAHLGARASHSAELASAPGREAACSRVVVRVTMDVDHDRVY
jgi:hypothetical protein